MLADGENPDEIISMTKLCNRITVMKYTVIELINRLEKSERIPKHELIVDQLRNLARQLDHSEEIHKVLMVYYSDTDGRVVDAMEKERVSKKKKAC